MINFKKPSTFKVIVFATVLLSVIFLTCNKNTKSVENRSSLALWEWNFKNVEDSTWREVTIPHDWSIEGDYSLEHGSDWQSGYLPAGIGVYEKEISVDDDDLKNKKIIIEFEGVYKNSTLYVNDTKIGNRPNGYVSFWYDISNDLSSGKNTLRVEVDHSKPLSGRWYTGSGIYRPVKLHFLNKSHVELWGTYFTTSKIENKDAFVNAQYEVNIDKNSQNTINAKLEIYNANGVLVHSETANAEKDTALNFDFKVVDAQLWSVDSPNLYTSKLILMDNDQVVDVLEQAFGIRTIEVSAENGLFINGESTLIKGVCLHQDAGPLGVAVPNPVLHRRLKLLKEMGANAIRTSHHPFSPDFYNMCDNLGIMVMNEAFDGWETAKAKHDYGLYFEDWWEKDLTDFIKRDRNHPSVIFWSIGNEVQDPTQETQKKLVDAIKALDSTRPITQGGIDPTRGMSQNKDDFQLDVKGFNGDGEEINAFEDYHAHNPTHPVIGTEVPHTYQTRGVYRTQTHWRRKDFPAPWEISSGSAGTMRGLEGKVYPIDDLSESEIFPEERQLTYFHNKEEKPIDIKNDWQPYLYYQSSYDNATVRSSARKAWQRAEELEFVMGQFRWTGFDYLGETNKWPSRFANFGVIDLCGFPKDHYYLYQSLWTKEPMLHILPHWTHPGKEGVEIPVVAYTNTDSISMSINGKKLDVKVNEGEQLLWHIPYEKGVLKAQAYKNGEIVETKEIVTASKPHHIAYNLDEAKDSKGYTVYQLELSIVDEDNVEVPDADNLLNINLIDAKWLGAENGDPLDLTSPRALYRKAFRGKAFCVFSAEPNQNTVIEITSENLEPLKLDFSKSKQKL